MDNLEPRWAALKMKKTYLIWKDADGSSGEDHYYAPPGAHILIVGVTVDASNYGSPDQPLYWAEFAGFQFGVTKDEFEWVE